MQFDRRSLLKYSAAAGALGLAGPFAGQAFAAREKELNILCWEGYNSDEVLDPFRRQTDANVSAESGTSDPDMINKLRAGEINVWDVINLNQPWARDQMWPEKLIKPLPKDRFEPYFANMMAPFNKDYEWCYTADGENLLGMVQRFGPFNFVVNTDKVSRATAEDEGFNLFNEASNSGKYGILTYDNWNIYHMCIGAGLDPFVKHSEADIAAYEKVARAWFKGAKLLTDDLVAMNLALINGEIDFYLTGGTYTSSPARLDGYSNIRGITPKKGPMAGGKGGITWVEVTSVVNNPQGSPLAYDFLEYVQNPEVCHAVAFAEGTYNPVTQMGNPKVFEKFSSEELDAIQWDSLEEELSNTVDYQINPDYDVMNKIYNEAKREA
ncbi:ABC transporter substrate-binding protein [Pelagibius marinus]|uniref:ABC transporter substrate-binding protein n=1 Tax=Pelagibius marinus TaxID=2762760 RepID=UPI001D04A61B|nr:PotD/PotF family extracellular solute-binding protein [Pelagibius marinus]